MFEITPELLLRAYAIGVFPVAESRDDPEVHWIDPEMRGVIPLDEFHISHRLARTLRQEPFEIRTDAAFEAVVSACAEAVRRRPETWINETIRRLYGDLHRLGHAHSVEAWRDGRLAGGLYGVALGRAFFGESMFSHLRDASKVALVHLVARLKSAGFVLLDIQFVTKHLEQFGAVEIPRGSYLDRLEDALKVQEIFPHELDPERFSAMLDEMARPPRRASRVAPARRRV